MPPTLAYLSLVVLCATDFPYDTWTVHVLYEALDESSLPLSLGITPG